MTYPDDDNGDALRRLDARGDDLTSARDVDFTVVFSDRSSAEEFAEHFRIGGYQTSVRYAEVKETHPWDVRVVKSMVPSHSGITQFEDALQEVADTLGGYNDGWGCFTKPGKHPKRSADVEQIGG